METLDKIAAIIGGPLILAACIDPPTTIRILWHIFG